MLCDICHKNEASIHIQEIVNGQKKSMHLCSSCAAAKQESEGLDLGPFNLAGLLYKLSGSGPDIQDESAHGNETELLTCPVCQWDESRLRAAGKLGCENCYKVFDELLSGALKNMHRGLSHLGKHPAGKSNELCKLHSDLAKLQKRLAQAVELEEYEDAAQIRDSINELKAKCEKLSEAGETC